jgi:predicted transcriptional regulator
MSIDGIIWHLTINCNAVGSEKMLTGKVSGELEMLERHLIILKCVVENEPIGILKLAEVTAIPSHKVRYSLRVLEQEGLIAASSPGAITTKNTRPFLERLDAMIEELVNGASSLKKIDFSR